MQYYSLKQLYEEAKKRGIDAYHAKMTIEGYCEKKEVIFLHYPDFDTNEGIMFFAYFDKWFPDNSIQRVTRCKLYYIKKGSIFDAWEVIKNQEERVCISHINSHVLLIDDGVVKSAYMEYNWSSEDDELKHDWIDHVYNLVAEQQRNTRQKAKDERKFLIKLAGEPTLEEDFEKIVGKHNWSIEFKREQERKVLFQDEYKLMSPKKIGDRDALGWTIFIKKRYDIPYYRVNTNMYDINNTAQNAKTFIEDDVTLLAYLTKLVNHWKTFDEILELEHNNCAIHYSEKACVADVTGEEYRYDNAAGVDTLEY